jgi:hypothetical protein
MSGAVVEIICSDTDIIPIPELFSGGSFWAIEQLAVDCGRGLANCDSSPIALDLCPYQLVGIKVAVLDIADKSILNSV